jgi:hypothetical protein
MRRAVRFGLTLMLLAAAAPAALAQAAAMVTEVRGEGTLVQRGQRQPLQPRAMLDEGEAVMLADGARAAIATLASARVYDAYGPGVFRLRAGAVVAEGAGRVERREIAAAIAALAVAPARNAQATIVMRSGERSGFAALSPLGRQLAADARVLRWRAAQDEGEWTYRVVLSDDDGVIVYEATTHATALALPPTVALARGRPYVFEVFARGPFGRTLEAAGEFVLIDEATETRIERARAAAGDDPSTRALLAVAYERHGLAQAAARAWEALGKR